MCVCGLYTLRCVFKLFTGVSRSSKIISGFRNLLAFHKSVFDSHAQSYKMCNDWYDKYWHNFLWGFFFFNFFLLYIYKMTMVWYLLCDHVRNDRFVCCCFFCLVTEMAEEVLYPLRARLTSLCSGWNGELPSCQLMIILLPVLFIFWSLSVTVNSWWHSLNNQSMVQTNSSILFSVSVL